MIQSFDHAIVLVPDLGAGISVLGQLGFEVSSGGSHPGWGTQNALVRFIDGYLEILAVHDRAEALNKGPIAQSLVEYIDSWGGGLVGYALETTNIEDDALRWKKSGLEADGPYPMERVKPDGTVVRSRFLVPYGLPWCRPWPFLIQWDTRSDEPVGLHKNGVSSVSRIDVAVRDLESQQALYETILGVAPASNGILKGPGPADRAVSFLIGQFQINLLALSSGYWIGGRPEGPYQLTVVVSDVTRLSAVLDQHGVSASLSTDARALTISDHPELRFRLCFEEPTVL